jgi:hypothetical protein
LSGRFGALEGCCATWLSLRIEKGASTHGATSWLTPRFYLTKAEAACGKGQTFLAAAVSARYDEAGFSEPWSAAI